MRFCLGLTGSIGMGKSTTAKLFAEAGCDVWDADHAVHRLYNGGLAVAPMRDAFPEAVKNNVVDRSALKAIIARDSAALARIEDIVHPLVAKDRDAFRLTATSDILVFDIPLLFETGGQQTFDAVAVVSIDTATQRERVLARGTMTEAQFEHIRSKQMPDADKRARADYVILTDTLDHARQQVEAVLSDIRKRMGHA